MTIRCLIMGFSPMHLIAAAAAVRTLHPAEDVECRFLFGKLPGLGAADAGLVSGMLRNLGRALTGTDSFVIVEQEWLSGKASRSRDALRAALSSLAGWDEVEELYFCHDATGTLHQALCVTYPAARRICYGDNIGLGTTREDAVAHSWPDHPRLTPSALKRLHLCRRMAASWRLDAMAALGHDEWPEPAFVDRLYFPPHLYCMSLPHLDAGVGPTNDAVVVVPRAVMTGCLDQVADASGIKEYEQSLLDSCAGSERPVLLLGSYLFETGYLSRFEDEVALLADAATPLLGPKGTLFVKPHPGELQSRIPALQERLGARATIVELDPRFARMPIEAFGTLCRASRICGFSGAALSLKHLYDADVVNPVTPAVLAGTITATHRGMLARTVSIMDEVMARMPHWDGAGWIFRNDTAPPGPGFKEIRAAENFGIPSPVTYSQDGLGSVHSCSFMSDPGFMIPFNAFQDFWKLEGAGRLSIEWRAHVAVWAASQALRLDGDFIECGVGKGCISYMVMTQLGRDAFGSRRYWLCDRWSDEPLDHLRTTYEADQNIPVESSAGQINRVRALFKDFAGVAVFVQGLIPDSLARVTADRIAFVHMDLNLANPEILAIRALWDRLVSGAPILLDDYGWIGRVAQREAWDAFAAEKSLRILSLPTGQGLLLKP